MNPQQPADDWKVGLQFATNKLLKKECLSRLTPYQEEQYEIYKKEILADRKQKRDAKKAAKEAAEEAKKAAEEAEKKAAEEAREARLKENLLEFFNHLKVVAEDNLKAAKQIVRTIGEIENFSVSNSLPDSPVWNPSWTRVCYSPSLHRPLYPASGYPEELSFREPVNHPPSEFYLDVDEKKEEDINVDDDEEEDDDVDEEEDEEEYQKREEEYQKYLHSTNADEEAGDYNYDCR